MGSVWMGCEWLVWQKLENGILSPRSNPTNGLSEIAILPVGAMAHDGLITSSRSWSTAWAHRRQACTPLPLSSLVTTMPLSSLVTTMAIKVSVVRTCATRKQRHMRMCICIGMVGAMHGCVHDVVMTSKASGAVGPFDRSIVAPGAAHVHRSDKPRRPCEVHQSLVRSKLEAYARYAPHPSPLLLSAHAHKSKR